MNKFTAVKRCIKVQLLLDSADVLRAYGDADRRNAVFVGIKTLMPEGICTVKGEMIMGWGYGE